MAAPRRTPILEMYDGFWQRNNKTLVHKTSEKFWTKNVSYLPTLHFTDCVTGNLTFFWLAYSVPRQCIDIAKMAVEANQQETFIKKLQ